MSPRIDGLRPRGEVVLDDRGGFRSRATPGEDRGQRDRRGLRARHDHQRRPIGALGVSRPLRLFERLAAEVSREVESETDRA